ncbi:flagellar biosynthetic protein FliO [Niallia sp. NCCP-28]|uniref:flagellar biosynthetic protein FliO n=1 Tax=Niallia sp. NCCP-28 TaxID=2934712 RepID=UPI00208B068B|nr:flagellar biosynthetic protein FliO [Niallia sp. NCCP-28]GKU82483.1 flagellar biosynthetic protein FliZ [Niallia sp. NCCP-28]
MDRLKYLFTSSLLIFVLIGLGNQAYAEQLDNSVHDMFEDSTSDEKESTKEGQGQTQKETNIAKDTANIGISFFDIVKMVFATVFVVALLYVLLKFINKRNHSYKSSQLIENLGGTSLGANRSIQIVKLGKRLLVVGVGENIHLIKEIEDEAEYKEILEDYNRKMDQLIIPSDIVTKVMGKANRTPAETNNNAPFAAHLKKQLQEISNRRKEALGEKEKKGSEKDE